MTWLGLIAFGSMILSAVKRRWFPWCLAIFAGIPYTVAVIFAGNGLIPFFLLAIVVATLMVVRLCIGAPLITGQPGMKPLAAFAAWSVFITLVGPGLFRGNPVLLPRGGTDQEVHDPSPLTYTISHIAQISYLLLGLCVVLYLANLRRLSPRLPSAVLWTGIGLSFCQLLIEEAGGSWPRDAFSNSPNVAYIGFGSDGVTERFRGIFGEPSALGAFGITGLVYFLASVWMTRGAQRVRSLAGIGVSAVVLVVGGTGTALAGGLVVLVVCSIIVIGPFLAGKTRWSIASVVTGIITLIVVTINASTIYAGAWSIVEGKLGGQSLNVRTASNSMSVDIAIQSWGLGVGLGSSKPNSFFAMLLSCVGVIGTVLFIVAIYKILRTAWFHQEYRPAVWALLSFFLVKSVSGSIMSSPIMFILLGVCAHGAWSAGRTNYLPSVRKRPDRLAPASTAYPGEVCNSSRKLVD